MSRLLSHYSKRPVALLCCDIQEKVEKLIEGFPKCVAVANRFADVHRALPNTTSFVVTEQYPKGVGRTSTKISLPFGVERHAKEQCSMLIPAVRHEVAGIDDFVIFGTETQVCILHTASELSQEGRRVFVAVDGTYSQRDVDRRQALAVIERLPNCFLATSESIMMMLVRDSDDCKYEAFAEILKRFPV